MARQAAGKVALVIAMVALLAGVAVFYQKMDGSRSSSASKEGSGKQDLGEGLKLQTQINDLKVMLKKLAMENSELKKAGAELKLRKQELQVCNSNLARLRKDKGKVENWATQVDDEKQAKSQKLKETRGKLENERVKSSELTQRVDAMQAKLSQTRGALKDIESQKEQSITKFREQKTKYSKLKQELATLKKSGEDKGRQDEIQRIIDEMNKDLQQKSSVIQELTKQKRASDDMLRRLEGKLMEAGVSSAEIDRATKPKATVKRESAPNPAAAALMQVGAGTGNSAATAQGKAELLFAKVDDNGDLSIDLEEFTRHLKPQLRKAYGPAGTLGKYVSRKFRELDRDRTGFVSKSEALRIPAALLSTLSEEKAADSDDSSPSARSSLASSLTATSSTSAGAGGVAGALARLGDAAMNATSTGLFGIFGGSSKPAQPPAPAANSDSSPATAASSASTSASSAPASGAAASSMPPRVAAESRLATGGGSGVEKSVDRDSAEGNKGMRGGGGEGGENGGGGSGGRGRGGRGGRMGRVGRSTGGDGAGAGVENVAATDAARADKPGAKKLSEE